MSGSGRASSRRRTPLSNARSRSTVAPRSGSPGSRRTIQQILETTPNLVYVYAVETVRLRYANPNLTTILGYSAERSWAGEGSEILPLVHPDDLPALQAHRDGLAGTSDGEVRELEVRVRHALGHHVTLRCRELVFKRDADGRPRLIIGTAEDVTERRRAADALRTANRQILLLNGITRHDILNQLNVLAGSLGLVRRRPRRPGARRAPGPGGAGSRDDPATDHVHP